MKYFDFSCVVLLVLAGMAAPVSGFDCQVFKPADGEVFVVGEPVHVEWRAEGFQPGDIDFVRFHARMLGDVPAYTEDGDLTSTSTIIRFERPGTYALYNWLWVPGVGFPGGCGGTSLPEITVVENHTEIPSAQSIRIARPFPSQSRTHGPEISIFSSELFGAIARDGSVAYVQPLEVRNLGDADLTLWEWSEAVTGEKVRLWPAIPVGGLKVAPGTVAPIPIRALPRLDLIKAGTNRFTQHVTLWSDSLGGESRTVNVVLYVYPDEDSVPDALLPPDCGDVNGDGVLDATDVIERILMDSN
ncbi:hypothetical protein HZA57_04705 [Candidatus Poribacteria bacterium]|nr:hypothetical protein [Candidatus Poribacteria bacterium]